MSNLLSKTKNKSSKQVGRGGTRGKTSGRGTKGQKARAGHRIRPHIRDEIKRLPKLRGRGKNSNKAFRIKPASVNLASIERTFSVNETVTPILLLSYGLVTREGGMTPQIKILATGEISKKLSFKGCLVSEQAKKKILAVGGTIL